MSRASFGGIVSSFERSAFSHVTALPVYAAMRPMIAASVLNPYATNVSQLTFPLSFSAEWTTTDGRKPSAAYETAVSSEDGPAPSR